MTSLHKALLTIFAVLLASPTAHAAVFDSLDTLPKNAGALGAFGELLLSGGASEGIEAHGRYGLSDDWNVGASLGTGSKDKKFRMGGDGVFNLIPDWQGQLGLSFRGSAMYQRDYSTGGLVMSIGPFLHKRFAGGFPANLYGGLLWQVETRREHVTSGSAFVLGSNFDVAAQGRYYLGAEVGVNLSHVDSYVLAGFGMRLGDVSFTPKEKKGREDLPRDVKRPRRSSDKDYTDEDFRK
ncbi:MAG TPA: hypothetical protein VIH99_02220 [Bdellovibrionota bacterium]